MDELTTAREAALEAGRILLAWRGRVSASSKDDGSPVTEADTAANEAIGARLRAAFPEDAILSEETADDGARLGMRRVWIVDPLDGTRDFVAGSDEFAVHVALAVDGQPKVAVVYRAAADVLHEATAGGGAFSREGPAPPRRLRVSGADRIEDFRLGVSRLAPGERLERLLRETPIGRRAVPMGASIKMMEIAAGRLEAVLTLHDGEKEWDTCAPALVLAEAGGTITDTLGAPFRWNGSDVRHRRGIVASNGRRHDVLVALCRTYWP